MKQKNAWCNKALELKSIKNGHINLNKQESAGWFASPEYLLMNISLRYRNRDGCTCYLLEKNTNNKNGKSMSWENGSMDEKDSR